jgi:N6-adenosine-specific RNA methylase IME4
MTVDEVAALPVRDLACPDGCVLFLWFPWPLLLDALRVVDQWGFGYKTCAFDWMKTNGQGEPAVGMGYWTRANTEACLLATRGKPRRLRADVKQAILEPRREHSRKPSVHGRIESLVGSPCAEIFAREKRQGWDVWGDQVGMFDQRGR